MKIAYNPTGGSALSKSQIDSLKNDIIFDLSGMAVYARGIPVGKVYLPFEKSTSSTTEGYNGLVPFPDYNGNSKTRFLREDGTWVVPTNTNNYRPISINGTPILENNNTVLNLVAGNNITLNPKKNSNNKYTGEVTITANAIGIKDLSGTSFSTYLKSSITYGYNSDETKKDNIVGDFGIFNMQTSSYTESNHFYFRQFRGQARIDKLYTRLYYKRENEDIKYTDWKEILKLGDYTTLAGYGITDAVKKVSNVSADVSESCVGYTISGHDGKENGGMFTALGGTGLYGSQLLGGYTGRNLYYRGKNNGDWTDWKTVAFIDSDITGNAESATKLKTARKIWGQNFDGTADVSGGMTGVTSIENRSGLSIVSNGLSFEPENAGRLKGALIIGGSVDYGLAIWGDGSGKSYLQSGRTDETNTAYNLIIQHLGGNVGIGTTSPTEKLQVNGNVKATSFLGNLDGSYINKLTGYTKATVVSNITANDTLNTALGKLELKAGTAYDLVKGAYDGDGTIENLAEILKVLEGISDTDTIKSLLGKYRRLDKDEFYGSAVHSKFWINRATENGGGWAYHPILVFKADKETKLLNIGVYGNNSDLIYSYIGSNDHNSTKNLRIYPDGTVTAPVFNGNLNYTNLTGSTTTANQAIVSNGTKDGWKLLTLGPGAFLDDYPMLNLGTLSDYVEYVLLLHPIAKRNSSDNWTYYYSYGTIYTHRSNGLGPSSSITYNSIPKYDSSGPTLVYVSMMLQGRKYALWCTCTYNGLKYCGLKLYISANHSADLTIKGRWNSDPVLVKYKKNQRTDSNGNITSEEIIHNEEIANSIVVEGDDIIINSTYGKFNGTFVTSGGTASQFVKGDGSLDSTSYISTTTLENYVTKTEFPNLSSKGLYKNLTSSGGSNINKWKKFARINLSSDNVYTQCGGYMFIYDHEGHRVKGILDFHVRTIPDTSINNSNINLQSPYLTWHILDNSNYASNIKMVKVENGIFDLYITTSQTYTTFVILVFTPKSDKITLFDETWIDTLPENVICTSSYTITVPNATTATKLANTLTFSAGNFTSKTYNGSSAVTVNIPTHTSHLTNDSFAVHNDVVKNVPSLTRSTLGYAYGCGDTCGPNLDSFWYTTGPVALFGTSKYLCAILASAGNNNIIKYKKVVNGSAQESWKTFVNSDGTQIGSSVRPVYVKNDGSVAPFTLSNATANDTRNILVGHDNGIYLVTSAKINPSAGILIANGFVKSGSSDSHVLLGAGGHKAISDFVLKSEFDAQELSSNLTTITIKSLKVKTDWMDTGIIGSYKNESNTLVSGNLETGTYIVQVYCSAAKSGGTSKFYNCYWSGVMSWYSGTNSTNSLGEDEILLHRSGHADNNCTIYLRTKLLSGSKGLKLLIAANQAMDGAEYTFKFKRVI